MKALAVIPARGGSKRIPGKNVRLFQGIPMIAHSIRAAIDSGIFADVVVSTDSENIANIAREYGAAVPFLRSPDIADDHTPVSVATLDALRILDPEGGQYCRVAQLMANCPLRDAADIRASYRQFVESGARSQISITRFGWLNPWWAVKRDSTLQLEPVFGAHVQSRSQDLPELYCPTGAIWWARAEALRAELTFHTSDRTGWEISWQHAVDIDTEEDWRMAEFLAPSRAATAAV